MGGCRRRSVEKGSQKSGEEHSRPSRAAGANAHKESAAWPLTVLVQINRGSRNTHETDTQATRNNFKTNPTHRLTQQTTRLG